MSCCSIPSLLHEMKGYWGYGDGIAFSLSNPNPNLQTPQARDLFFYHSCSTIFLSRLIAGNSSFVCLFVCRKWVSIGACSPLEFLAKSPRSSDETTAVLSFSLRGRSHKRNWFFCGDARCPQQSKMWREDRSVSKIPFCGIDVLFLWVLFLFRSWKLQKCYRELVFLAGIPARFVLQVGLFVSLFLFEGIWQLEIFLFWWEGRNICATIATTLVCWMKMKQHDKSSSRSGGGTALVVVKEKLLRLLLMSVSRGWSIWAEDKDLRNLSDRSWKARVGLDLCCIMMSQKLYQLHKILTNVCIRRLTG